MSRYVGIRRLYRGLLNIKAWSNAVGVQGAKHVTQFLSAKRKGVNAEDFTQFLEKDDEDFCDLYLRVQDTDHPYFDPIDGGFRIASHPHSNVSTARKKTFEPAWGGAKMEIRDGKESWKFTNEYLKVFEDHVLTKAKLTTKIPTPDFLAWLYRSHSFPDNITIQQLMQRFRSDFHIDDNEMERLFSEEPFDDIADSVGDFFSDAPIPNNLLLDLLNDVPNFDLTESLALLQPEGKPLPMNLEEIFRLLMDGRKQLILQGPPGTGKTFVARQLVALALGAEQSTVDNTAALSDFLKERQLSRIKDNFEQKAEETGGIWEIVQFHPSYTYEDFVRGISAQTEEKGGLPSFKAENRTFGLMAELSTKTTKPIVLVIDEINRGDLSKVLGELIYALEYRGEAVRTPYEVNDSRFMSVNDNFYLIATMNSADRSIALIDYAIRRRFDFTDILPDERVLTQFIQNSSLNENADRVLELFKGVSSLFENQQDYAVGHTYFMAKDADDLARRVIFQVLPLLTEYQREGIIQDDIHIPLTDWPGSTGLRLNHPNPFEIAGVLKNWIEGGNPLTAAVGETATVGDVEVD